MVIIACLILLVQGLLLLGVVIRDLFDPRREAITMKLVFIVGFLLFQTSSGIFTLLTGETEASLELGSPGLSGLKFAILSSIFITLALFTYEKVPIGRRDADQESEVRIAGPGLLLLMAVTGILIGVLLKDVLVTIPILGALTEMLSTGSLAAAAGCAAWAWSLRPLNMMIGIPALITIAGTCLLLLQNSFSRRGLVAAVIIVVWAAYFARWRYVPRSSLLSRALLVIVLGFPLILVQSATRGHRGTVALNEYFYRIATIDPRDVADAAASMASGQLAGGNSMWLLEHYPSTFSYMPLHSLYAFTTFVIPRAIWPGKPPGLGNEMVYNSGMTGVVREEQSLGPGIIGHTAVDIPFIAIPLYAFLLGCFLRALDQWVRRYPFSPFVVIPVGAATSQVLAIPRGELALFTFNAIAWIAGAVIALLPFRWLATRVSRDPCIEAEEGKDEELEGRDDVQQHIRILEESESR
jgi:hypothetical protein